MFGSKVKIDKELLTRATDYAAKSGYSSVEEFVKPPYRERDFKAG